MAKKTIYRIPVSDSTKKFLAESKTKSQFIYSFFPVDKADCPCNIQMRDSLEKIARFNEAKRREHVVAVDHMECPRDKNGMQAYQVSCDNCGAIVGQCWATDATLSDYCDLHYICYHDGEYWQGALGLNLSPIDGKIGFECACGSDTRDFRANTNLPAKVREAKIAESMEGRDFNISGAKFKVKKIDKLSEKDLKGFAALAAGGLNG